MKNALQLLIPSSPKGISEPFKNSEVKPYLSIKRGGFRLIFLSFFVLFLSSGAFAQDTKLISGAKRLKVEHSDVSRPLREMIKTTAKKEKEKKEEYNVPNKLKKEQRDYDSPYEGKDPVIQRKAFGTQKSSNNMRETLALSVSQPEVYQTFDGGSQEDNATITDGRQVTPPDTQGDVGPNHYIQMVNCHTNIFDKAGTNLTGPFTSNAFWQGFVLNGRDFSNDNSGDPVVLYDQFEDRWIVSHFAVSSAPYYQLIAVSKTGDPLGEYNRYAINFGNDFPDYPKLGVWNDAIYFTTRDFIETIEGFRFKGFSIVGIKKDEFYSGVGDIKGFRLIIPTFDDGILPADADGNLPPPPGTPHYSLFPSNSRNAMNLCTTVPDWTDPSNSTVSISQIPVAPYYFSYNEIIQPNGNRLDVLPWYLMYRLQYRNFGSHQSMAAIHSVQESSSTPFGIRWYEFRYPNGGSNWGVYQQGTYLPNDGLNRWMGSIAMNSMGEIALGYSVASSTLAPSIRYTGQSAVASGTGILDVPETSIFEGTLSISQSGFTRWGDYSMMSVDPINEKRFWYTQEFVKGTTGFAPWGTKIAEFGINSPEVAGPAEISVAPTTISITIDPDTKGSEDITISNIAALNSAYLNWNIAFDTSACSWLSLSSTSGYIIAGDSDSVQITANAFAMIPGDYQCTLNINSNDPVNPLVQVLVNLTVNYLPPPIAKVTPEALTFGVNTGESISDQLVIANEAVPENLNLHWSASIQGSIPGFGINPITGSAAPGSNNSINTSINAVGVSGGTYLGSIDFTTNDPDNQLISVPVELNVKVPIIGGRKLYVFNSSNPASIIRADLDGQNAFQPYVGLVRPIDGAVDEVNGKLYYIDWRIYRVDLSGLNKELLYSSTSGAVVDIALDVPNNHMYFAQYVGSAGYRIARADLDGSNLVNLANIATYDISGLNVVSSQGKIYWASNNGNNALTGIWRANLDLTQQEQLTNTGGLSGSVRGLSLDVAKNEMYWYEGRSLGGGSYSRYIRKATMNGLNGTDILNVEAGDIALDPIGGKVFWTEQGGSHPNLTYNTYRANTDGTNIEALGLWGYRLAIDFSPVAFDEEPPVAPTPPEDLVLQCASDVPALIKLTALDDIDGYISVFPTEITSPGNCQNNFILVRTWMFTDRAGNTTSVNQTITVNDDTAPVAPAPPADVYVQCASDVPPLINLTAIDNCDGPITVGPTRAIIPGTCANDFVEVRTWTFVDVCGNVSSVSQTITVKDDTAPVAPSPPADVYTHCATDVPPKINLTAIDNCDGEIMVAPTSVITPGACANDFVEVRTWTFVDVCGNSSSVSQKITVKDDTAPVAPAPPADVYTQCAADVPLKINLTAIDNCDGAIMVAPTSVITPGACANDFVEVRTWTFVDVCGNISSVSQKITVKDDTAPIPPAPPADVYTQCAANVPPVINLTAIDNCDGPITVGPTRAITSGTCTNDFVEVRTWTFVDVCGNTSSVSQKITVKDETAPILIIPPDITIECDQSILPANTGLATAFDNCDGPVSPGYSDSVTNSLGDNCYTILRTWTATDICGNSNSRVQRIKVEDTTPPSITCSTDVTVNSDSGSCTARLELSASATDNCDAGLTITAKVNGNVISMPYDFPFGTTDVVWTATDICGNASSCTQKVVVEKISTKTSVTVTSSTQQYSDLATFEATVTPYNCTGAGDIGGKVVFKVGTQTIGEANIVNGVATLADVPLLEPTPFGTAPTGQMAPGDRTVTAEFVGTNSNYIVSDPTTILTIKQEDANVDYTGQSLQATPSASSSTATVVLSANVQDIADSYRGDIRNATVTFVIRVDNNPDIPINPVPIPVSNLVIPGDNTLGTVTYNWNVDLGNSASESFTVGIVVSGYYARNSSDDDTVITIYKPVGDFITGGGTIIPQNSAGIYASTLGKKVNFGYNVGYTKKGNKLKGHLNIIFRRLESDGIMHVYQAKSNAIQSLGVNVSNASAKVATFITKCNLTDITDPLNVISIGGNLTLKVDMTDKGEPGTYDLIGFNLSDGSTLLFSSNWTGTKTTQIQLASGNVLIHSGYSVGTTREVNTDISASQSSVSGTEEFGLMSWPNPSKDEFYLKLNSANKIDKMEIFVYDINGRQIYHEMGDANKEYHFGSTLESGMYFAKVIQGDKSDQVRMIKY